MAHHHLGFHLFCCVERNADQNDNRGSTKRHVGQTAHTAEDDGKQRNDRKEQSADQCNLGEYPRNKVRSRFARAYTWDRTVTLTKIIGHFNRIILNCHIEVGKHQDQQEIDQPIHPRCV